MPNLKSTASGSAGGDSSRRGLRPASGFTLMELLVVVAIIAVLWALLSAALNNVKNKSLQISCISNLRQLQLAWLEYANDNDDLLPLNRTTPTANIRLFGRRTAPGSWVVGNPKEDASPEKLTQGTLFPLLQNVRVFRCPGDTSRVLGHKRILRTRSYSMSAYLNGDGAGIDPRVKTHYSEIINPPPERVFVFIEEHELSAWNGAFMIPDRDNNGAIQMSLPAQRHWDGCNLSFADGHVEYWKWLRPEHHSLKQYLLPPLTGLRHLQTSVPRSSSPTH